MDKKLRTYAELIIRQGINLEKGEVLGISADLNTADLVNEVVEYAYKEAGARQVIVYWSSPDLTKLNFEYMSEEELQKVPPFVVASRDYLIEEKGAYLAIISERPELLKDCDPQKIMKATIAGSKALEKFRESTGSNRTRWCMAAYPNQEWAEKVFPSLKGEKAMNKLWDHIHKTLRMDKKDTLAEWKTHENNLKRRADILNKANIRTFKYKNSLGTDFSVDMPKNYRFTGAAEVSFDGREFTANLPTEEVFSSPDLRTANGRLVASLPLCRRGVVIEDFWMDFKDGRVVDFGAKQGYETLKGIIETDEGSHYLGEIALVGYDSPIQNLKTLFFNTLFDENASCHFAVGRGFSACIENGNDYSKEELKEMGINDSIEHVDFMVGTKDLTITAIKEDGTEMPVFIKGDWAF